LRALAMAHMQGTETVADPVAQLRKFLTLRVVVATLLLGAGAVLYFRHGAREQAFFLLAVTTIVYFHTFFYHLLLRRLAGWLRPLKAALLVFDMVAASAVVAETGGQSSPYIFLFAILILVGSVMFSKTVSYATAAVTWLLYLGIIAYQLHTAQAPVEVAGGAAGPWFDVRLLYTMLTLVGFIIIAMLGGYLSELSRATHRELRVQSESLRTLRNLHENILQSITSGVLTLDLEGRIISVNRMALRLLGMAEERELLGTHIGRLLPDVDLRNMSVWRRGEVTYRSPDGRRLILGMSSSVLRDTDGTVMGHIIVFQDLTDIKELEQRLNQSERLALLGQLAAGLAHEIRNPLSAISGALEMIGDRKWVSEEDKRLVMLANKEVEKLNYLLEDFLILTFPSNNPDYPVDVNELIRETVDSFLTAVRMKALEIELALEEGEICVVANPHRFKQVIWNLLQNAKQAMPDGGSIVIETAARDGKAVIKVSDEGCGIDSEVLPRIFEPFFTTKDVGTGLGLAIAQKVIGGYNGTIDVLATGKEGTTFVIELPLCEGRVVAGGKEGVAVS